VIAALRAELARTNFAGREVSLAEGALVVAGACALASRTGRCADLAALAGIGGLGLLDDLLEPHQRRAGRPVSKGLRGHLSSLRAGRVTTGAAKALGIPALSLLSAAGAPGPRGGAMVPLDAALTAGCANLANLLDLRPGRALKVVLPAATLLALAPGDGPRARSGAQLAVAALLPGLLALPTDLRERGMLGDAGANVLGAAVGAAASRALPAPARLALLGGVVALTLVSERVSFSAVIDRTPGLRTLDRLGRLPVPAPGGAGPTPGTTGTTEEER
jgi:UDP-N-acetylmuramyl pentapeptide phosphotransferase/UDP-N-acetylglucosamine-1-phosphate transferase